MPGGITLSGQAVSASEFRLVVFGWSLAVLSELGVWEKLYMGEFGTDGLLQGLVAAAGGPEALRQAREAVRESRHGQFAVWPDAEGRLAQTLGPDGPQRAAAWAPGRALVMVGPPTEEAWEAMHEALLSPPA